ncbi:hypothetical protein ACG3SL_14350 [Sphingomonas sp. CJ20]
MQHITRHRIAATLPVAAAAMLLAGSLALYWPGYALYDSVQQYMQGLNGRFEDWHPPIMARLWDVLRRAVGGGAAPMFVVQLGLYWLGLGLIAQALARMGRPRAAAVVLVLGACPTFLGWQVAILKDAQMVAALVAGFGIVAAYRLAGRAVSAPGWAGVALLLLYATLVRSNAVFATAPLLVLLVDRPGWRWRTGAALAGIVLTIALTPLVNHRLLGARETGVTRTQPLYDRAGIAHFGGTDALPAPAVAAIAAKHCYSPFFWDPLGDDTRCDSDLKALQNAPMGTMSRDWVRAILHHPIAYAAHRLAHLNSTNRLFVSWNWPLAALPQGSEPNMVGLADPGAAARHVQALSTPLVLSPLGWPVCYIVVALLLLPAAFRGQDAAARLAQALLASALTLEASFALISISSDLRYHLWSMLATALAAILLARKGTRLPRAGIALLVVVLAVGTAGRLILPAAPDEYQATLTWAPYAR